MDPFEIRMTFLSQLRKIDANQERIQKVVDNARKHYATCGEDLWECIIEECQKGSINHRINILYFLDTLCETCISAKNRSRARRSRESLTSYVDFVSRDLAQIVQSVVPEGRSGLPNLTSTKQILESWRSKRVVDPQKIDDVLLSISNRATTSSHHPSIPPANSPMATSASDTYLSHRDVLKRIEEDRERHKRLRERRWVQPISHSAFMPNYVPPLASFLPMGDWEGREKGGGNEDELTLDIEFENEWEGTSDWNEDDEEACAEENMLCFESGGGEGDSMDIS